MLIIVVSVALTGCLSPTAGKINNISVGMSKKEVIETMGNPNSSAAPGGGVELLRYTLSENSDQQLMGYGNEYFVRLVNGRVESYGRMGDFNSTKNPTYNLNVDQTIRQR